MMSGEMDMFHVEYLTAANLPGACLMTGEVMAMTSFSNHLLTTIFSTFMLSNPLNFF